MSLHRCILVAVATLFSVSLAPAAFAGDWAAYGCGSCGGAYVPAYAPTIYAMPIAPAPINVGGCGVCGTPTAAVTFAAPVAPTPLYNNWGGGWSSGCCNSCNTCGAPAPVVYAAPAPTVGCNPCGTPASVYPVPAPLYVVNQGPDFSGPGIMVPYRTYAPPLQYAPPPAYPPYAAYPHPYYRAAHVYWHPHMYYGRRPFPHHYWRG